MLRFTWLLLFLVTATAYGQTGSEKYKYTVTALPKSSTLTFGLYVNELGQAFLPLNGGIYVPADSLWLVPQSKEYYFTSVAMNLKDTALFVIGNTEKESILFYVKSSARLPIQRIPIARWDRGLYHIIYRNGACYVWGYGQGKSRIGVLTGNGIEWLIEFKEIVTQVQVDKDGELYCLMQNAVVKLRSKEVIVKLENSIFGFDIDDDGKCILSCKDGIGIVSGGTLEIVATGLTGFVTMEKNLIFVLPMTGEKLYTLYK